MSEQSIFITGCSRGLGLEFAKQFLDKGYYVYASCRHPEKAIALNQLKQKSAHAKNLEILQLDVTDEMSLAKLKLNFKGKKLDILLNNAGIYGQKKEDFPLLESKNLAHVFQTNAISPLMVLEALYEPLKAGETKLVVCVSSWMGSIELNTTGGAFAYRASKTGLNSLMRSAAIELKKENIDVLLVHPGWVKTDMGTEIAPVEIKDSIEGLVKVIETVDRSVLTPFIDYQGNPLPW